MACCAILLEAEEAGNLVDDRPPMVSHRSTLQFVEKQMEVLRTQYADRAPRHYTIVDNLPNETTKAAMREARAMAEQSHLPKP
jgi:hypothetical protein